jgi:hypothetical protein
MNQDKKTKFLRFKQWIRKHRVVLISVGGVILLAGLTIGGLMLFFQKPKVADKPTPVVVQPIAPKPVKYYSPLTGEVVADEAATKQPVTGVMIENSPDARPQSGLKNSGVVFEAIAEGGITRFLVLYQQEKPQLLGPVRSIRLYDAEWLAAFNASIAHVGGSAGGLAEVRNGSYRDLDQFFNSSYYWRTTDHYAPHNVYTSFAKLDALNAAKGYTTSSFTGFSRVDGSPSSTPNATQISVNISSALFNSTYAYDKTTNTYPRSQAGAPHLDREDGQIAPSVVVALKVNESTVMQDGYREVVTTIGSGSGVIFQNGTAQEVTWHKDSKLGQVYFTDANGKDVALVRGQTWIAAVPVSNGSVTWQ